MGMGGGRWGVFGWDGDRFWGLWAYSVGVSWAWYIYLGVAARGSGIFGMVWLAAFHFASCFLHFFSVLAIPTWRRVWWFVVVFKCLVSMISRVGVLISWVLVVGCWIWDWDQSVYKPLDPFSPDA